MMKWFLVACVTAALLSLQTVLMAEDSVNDDKILAEEIKERFDAISQEVDEETRGWFKKKKDTMDRTEICGRILFSCLGMCSEVFYGRETGVFGRDERLGFGSSGGGASGLTTEQERAECRRMCRNHYSLCMVGSDWGLPK
jgi:hypothetical protein